MHRIHLSLSLVVAAFATGAALATPATDYEPYAKTLSTYVNDDGFVDYAGLQSDRASLDQFVDQLAAIDPSDFESWPEADRLALWINAYNALTLKAVIDHYPVDSIRDIGSVVKSVWDKLTFDVMGKTLTLNNIEHDILRKEFSEPRIHMAINCASIGCPPLLKEPYLADRLEAQFTTATKAFVAHPANFRIDRDDRKVYVSSIFNWFGDDFVPGYGQRKKRKGLDKKDIAVVNFLAGYVDEQDATYLRTGKLNVKFLDYDWNLNKQ